MVLPVTVGLISFEVNGCAAPARQNCLVLFNTKPFNILPRFGGAFYALSEQSLRAAAYRMRFRNLCVHDLPRFRCAAQRLRRLAERADESATHPLGIAETRDLGDALDGFA